MTDQGSPHRGFTELSHFEIDERSVRLLGRDFCLENMVVVLGKVDRASQEPVPVGMLKPFRRSLIQEAERALRRPVRPIPLNAWEIRRAIDLGYEGSDPDRDRATLELRPVAAFSFAPETPVPVMIDEILGHAAQLGASDVHIETYEHDVDVRFRIDGVLRQIATPLSRENIQAAITRLKVLSDLDIAERRKAQDGRIQALFREGKGRERGIDFRLSVVPGPFGEDAVLRLLDSAAPILGLEKLGFAGEVLPVFERLVSNPEGLLLVTGPTGSGKTTTLYAAIGHINSPDNKILTVEDPIEYHFPKTNQKQVSAQMTFADYARAFMRQNPDVILIGEIRDEETASAALRAAQTGHLVLSTLHTTDSVRTISRLHTLGVDHSLIAGSLLGAVSQRLARKLCVHCREEAPPSEAEVRRLGPAVEGRFFRAKGCEACAGAGYKGRIGLYELFLMDAELSDLVAEAAPIHRIRSTAVEKGMRTLRDDALAKAREGVTSLAEVLRVVPYRILQGG